MVNRKAKGPPRRGGPSKVRLGSGPRMCAAGWDIPACSAHRCLGLDSARRLARCPFASTVAGRANEAAD